VRESPPELWSRKGTFACAVRSRAQVLWKGASRRVTIPFAAFAANLGGVRFRKRFSRSALERARRRVSSRRARPRVPRVVLFVSRVVRERSPKNSSRSSFFLSQGRGKGERATGGKFRPKLNTERKTDSAQVPRGKDAKNFKRESKGLEIVGREAFEAPNRGDARERVRTHETASG